MNIKLFLAWFAGLFAEPAPKGRYMGRFAFRDADPMAFPFQMPAGIAGDVSRFHPSSIEPTLIDANAPPTAFGQAVLVDPTTQGVRPFAAGDTAVTVAYGVTVRPFPTQQQAGGMTSTFGSATPPTTGEIDVLRAGYIMVSLGSNGTGAAKKGAQVFIWCAAASGNHVQGGFEDAANGGNTASLDINRYTFNGVPDSSGNVELCWNV